LLLPTTLSLSFSAWNLLPKRSVICLTMMCCLQFELFVLWRMTIQEDSSFISFSKQSVQQAVWSLE
jgi:hypothetical protein